MKVRSARTLFRSDDEAPVATSHVDELERRFAVRRRIQAVEGDLGRERTAEGVERRQVRRVAATHERGLPEQVECELDTFRRRWQEYCPVELLHPIEKVSRIIDGVKSL